MPGFLNLDLLSSETSQGLGQVGSTFSSVRDQQKQMRSTVTAIRSRSALETTHYGLKSVRAIAKFFSNGLGSIVWIPAMAEKLNKPISGTIVTHLSPLLSPFAIICYGLTGIISISSLVRDARFRKEHCKLTHQNPENNIGREKMLKQAILTLNTAFPYTPSQEVASYQRLQKSVGETCARTIQQAQKTQKLNRNDFEYLARQNRKKMLLNVLSLTAAICLIVAVCLTTGNPIGLAFFILGYTLLLSQPVLTAVWLENEGWGFSLRFLNRKIMEIKRALEPKQLKIEIIFTRAKSKFRRLRSSKS